MTGALDLTSLVAPGDRVLWGQVAAEPIELVRILSEQAGELPDVTAFCTAVLAAVPTLDAARSLRLTSYGALGGLGALLRGAALEVLPQRMSDLRPHLEASVVLLGVSPADQDGHHSLSLGAELIADAVQTARLVIAEVNDQLPFLPHAPRIHTSQVVARIETSRPPSALPASTPSPVDDAIAARVAGLVEDGATIQLGVGALPEAVARALAGHRNLSVHSGMVSDGLRNLIDAGAVTGRAVAGLVVGTAALYDWIKASPEVVEIVPVSRTHDPRILLALSRFTAINSAVEVDLSGQVNAEAAAGAYVGAVGGQADFARAATSVPGGRSIVALPSRTENGRPRIVASLSGPVTVARCDADWVVTENGAAQLRGQSLAQRASALIAIAHSDDRATLEATQSAQR